MIKADKNMFMSDTNKATRNNVIEFAYNTFSTSPEYLWRGFPNYAVFRRADNKKWYGIIMDIPKNILGLSGVERVDILDIKCSPELREMLLTQKGFLPAYHLNRENWIGVLLDGSVDKNLLFSLIEESYKLVGLKSKKLLRREPISWLIPANPKIFDIQREFDKNGFIMWKQKNSVIVGDTIYIYDAAPLSCIHYKCKVVEVDLPYDFSDEKIKTEKAMKLELIFAFDTQAFTLNRMKKHGISYVRGARKLPYGLMCELEKESVDGKEV